METLTLYFCKRFANDLQPVMQIFSILETVLANLRYELWKLLYMERFDYFELWKLKS